MSMVDPSILSTKAYEIIREKFQAAIEQGPTYICDICIKWEYNHNVKILNPDKYDEDILINCCTGKSDWICNSCDKSMKNNKIPMQAQANNLQLCPKLLELERLCPSRLCWFRKLFHLCSLFRNIKVHNKG